MSDAVELPDHFLPARIESIEQVTPLIKVFTLAADPQRFTSKAGQWLDLVIPQPEGKPFVGGYSVVSAPRADGRLQLAIKYADHHHATHHLHAVAQEGDTVYITPGQGSFFFEPGMARNVVLLGAGIGVTPLFGILRAIHADMPEVYAHLVYSVAHQDEVLFPQELEAMAKAPNIDVSLTVTRPTAITPGGLPPLLVLQLRLGDAPIRQQGRHVLDEVARTAEVEQRIARQIERLQQPMADTSGVAQPVLGLAGHRQRHGNVACPGHHREFIGEQHLAP